jgi:glycosyltransferase involved in cell wall biosynthesis
MNKEFPRLLVAAEFPPNSSGGGAAVLRQMLKEWPVEKLFWWSCFPDLTKSFNQKVAAHTSANIPPKWFPNRRLRLIKIFLMERIWAPWAARHLRKTLRRFEPDVIWAVPHSWAIGPLAAALPQSGIGFHVTMQDYLDINNRVRILGKERSSRLAAMAAMLYTQAKTRDATSDSMLDDLRARTGYGGSQMLHAGLEPSDFSYLETKSNADLPSELRIAYAGTVVVERDFAIFVEALTKVRNRLPVPVKLVMFGTHSYRTRPWFDPSWIREVGDLAEPKFSETLRECVWGFAPMSLVNDDFRYNRFSFPTKFISYLAAGLPVITLGHRESSVIKMARAYRVGVCITSDNCDALESKIMETLSIKYPWTEFGTEIIRCGREKFDAVKMRKRLYECFFACAAKTKQPSNEESF